MKTKIMFVTALFALAGLFISGTLVANAKQTGDTRPGWGYGDSNHEHTGPSGVSVVPDPDQAGAPANSGNSRPGNGNGDKNHGHSGRP